MLPATDAAKRRRGSSHKIGFAAGSPPAINVPKAVKCPCQGIRWLSYARRAYWAYRHLRNHDKETHASKETGALNA